MTGVRARPLEATAFHEAGHAAMAWRERIALKSVSIVPACGSSGRVFHHNPLAGIRLDCDGSNRARLRAERLVRVCFAGRLAQARYRANSYRRWHSGADDETAMHLLSAISASDRELAAYSRLLEIQTEQWLALDAVWNRVEALAAELLRRREVSGKEAIRILEDGAR
jgi:hypothetical protein